MYGRRRGGGRGYRSSNPIGTGSVASRLSPDGLVRGGFYNTGYRNFNRGFGRGQGRCFQSPQPVRKGDLFMEAGRLAAEYLVAKGMLPPIALPPKLQNGGFRKEVGEFQEFRQQDGEYMQHPLDSRTSALARLGSFEGGSERKRYPNDYNAVGSKHNLRGGRETGSYSNYDSDRGQENGKSGSISGRSRAFSDKEADDDALSVHCNEQLTTKDDEQNPKVVELAPKSNGTGNSPSEADTHQLMTYLILKTNSSITGKDSEHLTNMEVDKEPDGFDNIIEDGEMKDSKNTEVTGQHSPVEDSVIQPNQGAATPATRGNELLQLCNFAKVPTKTRSLRSRGSKGSLCTTVEEENNSAGTSTDVVVAKSIDSDVIDRSLVNVSIEEHTSTGTPVDPELLVDDVVGLSESNAVLDQNLDLTTREIKAMDNSGQSFGKVILLDPDGSAEGSKCLESVSFPDRSFTYSEKSNQGPLGSKGCGSLDEFVAGARSEKRVLDECDIEGTFKKLKAWPPSMISQVDEYPHLSHLIPERSSVIERTSQTNNLMKIGQASSSRISGFTTLGDENSIGYNEDKQMIDSSFKICDLNLMEGSQMDENHDGSQMMFFPSMLETKKESLSVDGGLTIGDNSNTSHKYSTIGAHGEELEIINLDNDYDDDRAFNPEEKREDAVYTGLESFPRQPRGISDGTDVQDGYGRGTSDGADVQDGYGQGTSDGTDVQDGYGRVTSDGTDVQDGYGLMISELLGNEIPNCSTVGGDITSLHDDMSLHNGQGILPEDDPIYMTLGEIPIGFWEPPNPYFGKPF